jgi:hypothetical protein
MLPTAADGGFAGRPATQVPGVANLFLVGDWIGPEGFLADASLASARSVAQQVLTRHTPTIRERRPIEAGASLEGSARR